MCFMMLLIMLWVLFLLLSLCIFYIYYEYLDAKYIIAEQLTLNVLILMLNYFKGLI